MSKKRQEALRIYRVLRADYLASNPTCQVCQKRDSQDIHHKLPLGRGGRLCDERIFVAVCRVCHDQIHADPKWAELHQWLLRRAN